MKERNNKIRRELKKRKEFKAGVGWLSAGARLSNGLASFFSRVIYMTLTNVANEILACNQSQTPAPLATNLDIFVQISDVVCIPKVSRRTVTCDLSIATCRATLINPATSHRSRTGMRDLCGGWVGMSFSRWCNFWSLGRLVHGRVGLGQCQPAHICPEVVRHRNGIILHTTCISL